MKRILLIVMVLFIMSFVMDSCSGDKQNKTETTEQAKATAYYYTCEMDPDVKSEQPGKCPKCGCEMIKKEGELKKEEMKQDTTKK
jgi:Cu(I)/Ag(I) efflux system membrane fusion protein